MRLGSKLCCEPVFIGSDEEAGFTGEMTDRVHVLTITLLPVCRMRSRCCWKGVTRKLWIRFSKRVDKWGDAKEKEIEDFGMDRETYEFAQYRDFRSLTETMFTTLKLQSGQLGNGITIQALFRDQPEGAMFDTLIAQDPDDRDQVGIRARVKTRLAPALDDFVFGAISLRLGGERLLTFNTACGSNRVIKGLRALSIEFTINQENIQRRTRLALPSVARVINMALRLGLLTWRYPALVESATGTYNI